MVTVTALARPDLRLHASWAAAMLEFGSEHVHGAGAWEVPAEIRSSTSREACAVLVSELARRGDPQEPRPADRVPSDYFWITDRDRGAGEVVGFLALRHELTSFLLDTGGHIGYSVRPSRRGEGHAGRALELGLDHAARLGLPRVLLTCDRDNEASRRTIESAGGELEDVRERTMRFWIDLAGRERARARRGRTSRSTTEPVGRVGQSFGR